MAEKASGDRIAADMAPPNYRSAVQKIRGDIVKKKDRISGINGEIADIWAKIEGLKCSKKGAKMFATLDKMEPDERGDVIRTLNGMMDAAGWDEDNTDLVDQAEGQASHLRLVTGSDASEDDGDDEAADEQPVAEAPAKRKRGRKPAGEQVEADRGVAKNANEARERVREHFGQPAGEPFTGDNSDLADE